ncbi:MAG TPA: phosphatase PAP2 family protein [Thermomicrobiales bacterium]|nr:phosphatase PAP2 family protein [Thermomicrobiales bacterium]
MARRLLKFAYVGSAIAASAAIAMGVKSGRTQELDEKLTRRIQKIEAPGFAPLMHAVSWAGFPPQSKILPLLIPTAMLSAGRSLEALFQLMGWGTGAISGGIKRTMKRPRPNHPEIVVAKARLGGSSFPSGHVIIYTGVYGFLAYLAHVHIKVGLLRKAVVGLIAGMVALVGTSRVYLGHHFTSDAIVSYLLGTSYLIGLISLYQRIQKRSSAR